MYSPLIVADIITLNYPYKTSLVLSIRKLILWECVRADFTKFLTQSKFTDLYQIFEVYKQNYVRGTAFWYYLQRQSPLRLWQHRMRTAEAELGTQHQATENLCGSVVARKTGAEPAVSSVEVLKHRHKYGEVHSTTDTRVSNSSSYRHVTMGLLYRILLFLPHTLPRNKPTDGVHKTSHRFWNWNWKNTTFGKLDPFLSSHKREAPT
jgi:hypothetical protein